MFSDDDNSATVRSTRVPAIGEHWERYGPEWSAMVIIHRLSDRHEVQPHGEQRYRYIQVCYVGAVLRRLSDRRDVHPDGHVLWGW